jgi:hypothetical protein
MGSESDEVGTKNKLASVASGKLTEPFGFCDGYNFVPVITWERLL